MKFIFKDIPEPSKFALFDRGQEGPVETFDIPVGDAAVDFDIPDDWQQPHYALRTLLYYISDAYVPITDTASPISISGADYYLDITRPDQEVEQNWKSVENLVVAINGSDLDPRQKFFTGLLSLNSYFEFVVHAMLVQSGHISYRKFKELQNHKNRIEAAFKEDNTSFFATKFEVCPGKSVQTNEVSPETRTFLAAVMNDVRKMRNDVAHKWGYRDVPEERIKELFETARVNLPYAPDAEAFFEIAAQLLTAIWAKIKNPLDLRYKLIAEREAIRADRVERGYAT